MKLYYECRWDVIGKTTLNEVVSNNKYIRHEDRGNLIEVFYDSEDDPYRCFYKDMEELRGIVISNHEHAIRVYREIIEKAKRIKQ